MAFTGTEQRRVHVTSEGWEELVPADDLAPDDDLPPGTFYAVRYAYKPVGVFDPTHDQLIWLLEGATPPPGYEPYYIIENFRGTRGAAGQGPWATCWICRYDYPISQMVLSRGKYYCREQKCSEDLE